MKRAMGGAGGFAAQSPTVLVARALRKAAVPTSSRQPETCRCVTHDSSCSMRLLLNCGAETSSVNQQAAGFARRGAVAPHRIRAACGPYARGDCVGVHDRHKGRCRDEGH